MKKPILAGILGVSLAFSAPEPVFADGGDAILGFILGMGIGAAAKSNSGRRNSGSGRVSAPHGDPMVQTALNYYNFDAGKADGQFGPATRAAISRYQTAIGEPATGQLTKDQTEVLLAAYQSDLNGTPSVVAGTGKPSFGTGTPVPTDGGVNAPMATLMASLGAQTQVPGQGPVTVATEGQSAAIAQKPATLCESGPMPETDAARDGTAGMDAIVLNYCAARGYALGHSADIAKTVVNFDPAVSGQQCTAWLNANGTALSAAAAKAPEDAVRDVKAMFPGLDNGQMAALRDSFSICQGIAEAADSAESSRSFAVLVAGLGGAGYGELVAGSAAVGLGTGHSGETAKAWYLWTAEGLDGGGPALIPPEKGERVPVLLALADSAAAGTQDWQAYVAAKTTPVTAATTGGLALPGLTPVVADPADATMTAAGFEEIYHMTREQALEDCRAGGTAMADLGRSTCRALAQAANDPLLAAQFR